MQGLNRYLYKIIKHLKLLKCFNILFSKRINGVKVKIPIIHGIGIVYLIIKTDWLNSIIRQFTNHDDPCFVDVGVSIGTTLIMLKTLQPHIKYIGFEPNTASSFYTKQLIKSNNFQNCALFDCALSSGPRIHNLEMNSIIDSSASIIASQRPGHFKGKEQVIGLDYDSFFADQEISFIKIDVEGSELEVITGMKQSIMKYKPIIICKVLDSYDRKVLEFT